MPLIRLDLELDVGLPSIRTKPVPRTYLAHSQRAMLTLGFGELQSRPAGKRGQ